MKEYKPNVIVKGNIRGFAKIPNELLENTLLKDCSIVLLSRIIKEVNRHKYAFHYSDEFFYKVYGYTERRLKTAKKELAELKILTSSKMKNGDKWEYFYILDYDRLKEFLSETATTPKDIECPNVDF